MLWMVYELSWKLAGWDRNGRVYKPVKTWIGQVTGDNHAQAKNRANEKWPGKCTRLEQCKMVKRTKQPV